MIWKFRYRKQAFSFLNGHDLLEPVRDKIASYISGERVDIKKLKGRWRGFLRLRIGKVRVVF